MKKSLLLLLSIFFLAADTDMSIYYRKNKPITEQELNSLIQKSDIVYVGEQHDKKGSHEIQLEVIKKIFEKKGNKIAVGFEMLNSTLQNILDEYISGNLTEEEFLTKIDWKKEWGFDYNLYKPIFDFIKEKKLKAIALNVPRKIVSKIARGGLEVLSEDEKNLIAKEIKVVNDKKYNDYLLQTFSGHGENPMNKIMSFENYRLSMAVWNESMGEKVNEFLKNNNEYSFVVIAGNGHIMYNAAIPWSVKRRIKGFKHLSIYTESDALKSNTQKMKEISKYADIIWFYKE
ncbi:MAG: ChaN family lipoprotein [Elusimicrobiota bacterium]